MKNPNDPQNPMARQNGLVVQEMPDEVLVYDLDTNKAHCLNQSAALVWKSCDGNNSVGDIVRQFESNGGGTKVSANFPAPKTADPKLQSTDQQFQAAR